MSQHDMEVDEILPGYDEGRSIAPALRDDTRGARLYRAMTIAVDPSHPPEVTRQ